MLIGTAAKLVGNLLLIPFMGVDGAALSTTLCYGVILVMSVRIFVRASGVRIKMMPLVKVIYAGAMCGAGAYLTAAFLQRSGVSEPIVKLVLSGAVGGIVYLVLVGLLIGRTAVKKCRT